MLTFWLIIIIPLLLVVRIEKVYFRFLLFILAPIFTSLVLVWVILVGAPPGLPLGSDPKKALEFACIVSLRLALLAGIFQLCFLSIPKEELITTFRRWGLKGDTLIILVGAFTVWPELKLRAEQILTSCFARGLVTNRRVAARLSLAPVLMRPLVTWILRASLQRTEMWRERNLLDRFEGAPRKHSGNLTLGGLVILLLSLMWLVLNLVHRFL